MNGFKDDVISILRDNVMLHGEAIGWIMTNPRVTMTADLYKYMVDNKYPVTPRSEKSVLYYDYIVIDRYTRSVTNLLRAFANVSENGLIVIEISDELPNFSDRYVSKYGNFTATRVQYGDRYYLVLRTGVDYGN